MITKHAGIGWRVVKNIFLESYKGLCAMLILLCAIMCLVCGDTGLGTWNTRTKAAGDDLFSDFFFLFFFSLFCVKKRTFFPDFFSQLPASHPVPFSNSSNATAFEGLPSLLLFPMFVSLVFLFFSFFFFFFLLSHISWKPNRK